VFAESTLCSLDLSIINAPSTKSRDEEVLYVVRVGVDGFGGEAEVDDL